MNILNRNLTIVEDAGTNQATCTAGCILDLNPAERASLLNPFGTKGFQLDCVLLGNDPGSDSDDAIFTFGEKVFNNFTQIFEVDQVFRKTLGTSLLNEDVNGSDEIIAEFTLTNLSNGASVVKRSNQINRTFT